MRWCCWHSSQLERSQPCQTSQSNSARAPSVFWRASAQSRSGGQEKHSLGAVPSQCGVAQRRP
eukprot:6241622-Lingulodinium_polyedra.AAC.1